MRTCSTPPVERAERGVQLGLHAAGGDAVGDQTARSRRRSARGRSCFCAVQHAFDIGQEDQLLGAESGGARDRHLVGIDVVDLPCAVAGHAGDHRQVAVARSAGRSSAGIGAGDAADRAQRRVHLLGLDQQRIDAGEPHGAARRRDSGWRPVRD